jgi:hypothetical protein
MSSTAQGHPEGPLNQRQKPVVKGKYLPAQGKSSHWEENIARLATFEDQDRLGSILLGHQ